MARIPYTAEDWASVQPLLGRKIKALRELNGLTQREVAERIGRGQAFVVCVEHGNSLVSLPILLRLCHALGCTPNDLLGWPD